MNRSISGSGSLMDTIDPGKGKIMGKLNFFKLCSICLLMCFLLSACGAKQPWDRPAEVPAPSFSPEAPPATDEPVQEESDENTVPTEAPSVWDARYEKAQSAIYETEATLGEEIYQAGAVRRKPIGDIMVDYSFYLSEEDFQSVTALLQQESIPVTTDVYKTAFNDWFSVSAVEGMCIKEYFFPLDAEYENETGKYFVYKETILEGTYANQKISFCGYISDDIYETIYEVVESYLTDLP